MPKRWPGTTLTPLHVCMVNDKKSMTVDGSAISAQTTLPPSGHIVRIVFSNADSPIRTTRGKAVTNGIALVDDVDVTGFQVLRLCIVVSKCQYWPKTNPPWIIEPDGPICNQGSHLEDHTGLAQQ